MDCQARSARRLFWGFGWDDLRPRIRYERTNGPQVPFSGGSQWSSEMSHNAQVYIPCHNEKNILHISKVYVSRKCALFREASQASVGRGGRMIQYHRC